MYFLFIHYCFLGTYGVSVFHLQEEKTKEYRREKRKERKRRAREGKEGQDEGAGLEEEEEVDPELAAMMGFSGFGSKRTKS